MINKTKDLIQQTNTAQTNNTITVKDKQLVDKINNSLGKRVRITYEEHKGIPSSCFGETPYFVKNVQLLEKDSSNQSFN